MRRTAGHPPPSEPRSGPESGGRTGTEQSGLVRGFFLGEVDESLLLPYPPFEGEQAEAFGIVRESLEEFARDHIDARRIDEEGRIPPEVFSGLAEIGVFGVQVPEELGGFGASMTFYCKVFETLSQFDMSVVTMLGAHSSIGLKGLLLFGTPEQQATFLPALARGEKLAAFALTEPGAGSDAAGIKTRAAYDPATDEYVLNGTKIWITNGGIARVFTVFAQTEVEEFGDRRDRISAFIVPRETPGVSTGAEEHKLGIKGSSTTEVHFQDVRVPSANLLGPKGKGFKVAMEVLNSGRLGLAAGCIGGGRAVLREALRHAGERRQFGKALVEFELIRAKLARMDLGLYGMESMVYLTTGLVDRGVRDVSIESAICKVHCSEAIWAIVNEALQIAGGMGYMKDHPYERLLRDARINLIFEGTNEILRLYTALTGLQHPGELLREVGRALRHPIGELGVLTEYAARRVKRGIGRVELRGVHPALAEERGRLAEYVAELAGSVEGALRGHGKGVVERQIVLERFAEAANDLYLMAAVISRADAALRRAEATTEREAQEGSVAAAPDRTATGASANRKHGKVAAPAAELPEVLRCRILVNEAWRRARRNLAMVASNSDADVLKVADHVVERGGYAGRQESL